jgi:hypothetical protein
MRVASRSSSVDQVARVKPTRFQRHDSAAAIKPSSTSSNVAATNQYPLGGGRTPGSRA